MEWTPTLAQVVAHFAGGLHDAYGELSGALASGDLAQVHQVAQTVALAAAALANVTKPQDPATCPKCGYPWAIHGLGGWTAVCQAIQPK